MIRKAVIPLAGLGTRMRPFTFAAPKAMLPLIDAQDRVRPVVDYIVSEAASSGAVEVALVVSPGQREPIEKYFAQAKDAQHPARLEFIVQDRPLGFGHAVLQAASFVGGEPFMLLLGDHVYQPARNAPPCAAQVASAFARCGGAAMIGMQAVGREELPKVGVAKGEPIGEGVYRCTAFVEKPTAAQARKQLKTAGLPAGKFLAHCGIYLFSPEILRCLEELAAVGKSSSGEIQLADTQSMLLSRHKDDYYLFRIAGRAYDVGAAGGYAAAFKAMMK